MCLNNDIYYDQAVQHEVLIHVPYTSQEHNTLTIQHHGKRFGESNTWDVVTDNGQITQDRAVRVIDIEIDGVSVMDVFYDNGFVTDQGTQHTHYLGHNGVAEMVWPRDFYSWLIKRRFFGRTLQAPNLIMETSHSHLFDYTEDLRELEALDQLLEQHAHLFDKSA